MKGKFVKLAAAVLIMSTLSAYAAAPKFEFFWPNADRSGWQAFFLLDAAKRRLGSKADFQIITTAAKDAKGEWTGDVSEPMDIKLPKLDGINATKQVRLSCPQTNVLMLSSFEDEAHVMWPDVRCAAYSGRASAPVDGFNPFTCLNALSLIPKSV